MFCSDSLDGAHLSSPKQNYGHLCLKLVALGVLTSMKQICTSGTQQILYHAVRATLSFCWL